MLLRRLLVTRRMIATRRALALAGMSARRLLGASAAHGCEQSIEIRRTNRQCRAMREELPAVEIVGHRSASLQTSDPTFQASRTKDAPLAIGRHRKRHMQVITQRVGLVRVARPDNNDGKLGGSEQRLRRAKLSDMSSARGACEGPHEVDEHVAPAGQLAHGRRRAGTEYERRIKYPVVLARPFHIAASFLDSVGNKCTVNV